MCGVIIVRVSNQRQRWRLVCSLVTHLLNIQIPFIVTALEIPRLFYSIDWLPVTLIICAKVGDIVRAAGVDVVLGRLQIQGVLILVLLHI